MEECAVFMTGILTYITHALTATAGCTSEVWLPARNRDHAEKLFHGMVKEARARARLGFEPMPAHLFVADENIGDWFPAEELNRPVSAVQVVRRIDKNMRRRALLQYYRRFPSTHHNNPCADTVERRAFQSVTAQRAA